MKKLLSVMFMVLCGITAIHADGEEKTQTVECGQTVKMTATPQTNQRFSRWEMEYTGSTTISLPTTYHHGDIADDYTCTTDGNGVNTLTVTLPSSVYQPNAVISFEAIFENALNISVNVGVLNNGSISIVSSIADVYVTINGVEKKDNNSGYANETATLSYKNVDDCYEFVGWRSTSDLNTNIDSNNNYGLTISTDASYVAVFKKKSVTVKVKTADTSKGSVSISIADPSNN